MQEDCPSYKIMKLCVLDLKITSALSSVLQQTDADDVAVKGVSVGILYVLEDCRVETSSSPKVQNIALIFEESVVLQDIPDTPTALAYLFGLLYALHISFPKDLKYTFDTLQYVFMGMGPKCTQHVRSLKNKLAL